MNNCKDKKIRIYKSEVEGYVRDYLEEDDKTNCPPELMGQFVFFAEDDIVEEYFLEGLFFLNPDYDDQDEPSYYNRKYKVYSEDDFTTNAEIEVFSSKSERQRDEACANMDHSYFCQDENFDLDGVGDSQQVYNYHDGNNWNKIVLESDCFPVNYMRISDFDNFTCERVYSSKNGQGQGHEEIYEVLNEEGKHIAFFSLGVSYWQGSLNNAVEWVSPEYVNEKLAVA